MMNTINYTLRTIEREGEIVSVDSDPQYIMLMQNVLNQELLSWKIGCKGEPISNIFGIRGYEKDGNGRIIVELSDIFNYNFLDRIAQDTDRYILMKKPAMILTKFSIRKKILPNIPQLGMYVSVWHRINPSNIEIKSMPFNVSAGADMLSIYLKDLYGFLALKDDVTTCKLDKSKEVSLPRGILPKY